MKEDYRMTEQEITSQVADIHVFVDGCVTELCDHFLELERLIMEGVKIGMVKPLAGKRAIREIQALRGKAAEVGLGAADAHIYHHKVASGKGLVTPDLNTVGGVTVLSGGR